MGSISTVEVPSSYSSSCSGSLCTWISPAASAVMFSSIGWPASTSTRSPLGSTVSPSKVTSMVHGRVAVGAAAVVVAARGEPEQRDGQDGRRSERAQHVWKQSHATLNAS